MVALVNCSACVPRADMAGFDEASIVGQLESERIELTAEFAEPVTERLVIEGQRVAAGDTILRQDQQRAAARLRSATASLAQHQARLDELTRGPREEQIEAAQASLHGARRDLDFRRTELERVQSLLDRDLASPNQRDRARADLDTAEASVEVHRARLDELLSGTRVEELEQAGAAVDIAAAQLQQAEIDMQRHVALAPVDATVDSLLLETGERPAR
jgi:HlyD family secretion protein